MKLKILPALLSIAAVVCASGASAETFVGNTAGQPTYNRTNEGAPPTSLSSTGTAVPYLSQPFFVSSSGVYTLSTDAQSGFDAFLSLYEESFDPLSPLANVVAANDDGAAAGNSLISAMLAANTQFYFVMSGFRNSSAGAFTGSIAGPGVVSLGLVGPNSIVAAAPEPATWAMMLIGFGSVGFALRRRKSAAGSRKVRVAHA